MAAQQTDNPEVNLDLSGLEEMVDALMTGGYTFKDFADISDEEMEAVYATAFNLVNQNKYDKAEAIFAFLCHLEPYDGRFWLGLGVCRQMLKKYEEATKAYAMAGIHDMENPVPPLRAAECFLAMGKLEDAEMGISATLHWAGDKTEYQELKNRAEVLMNEIQRRKGDNS
jgi:type III secretion system low calcium response chaperone LcrH/SycD